MSMALGKVFEPFVEQRPICVMARGVLEHLFNAERIDALFARTAKVQYTRAVLFSSVVDLMGQVVLGVPPVCMPPIKRRRPSLASRTKPFMTNCARWSCGYRPNWSVMRRGKQLQ